MTQVKDKTDQQLNRALAELMGYTIKELPIGSNGRQLYALMTPTGRQRLAALTIDNAYLDAPDYCNDTAASLEVQAKAIEVDAGGYIQNLLIVMFGEPVYEREFSNRLLDFMTAAKINNATPRERAEAAYITLQGTKGVEKIADR